MLTQDQVRDAYAIIAGIPRNLIDLERFYTKRAVLTDAYGCMRPFSISAELPEDGSPPQVTCGTIACAAGFLLAHPEWPTTVTLPPLTRGTEARAYALLQANHALFAPRDSSVYDEELSRPRAKYNLWSAPEVPKTVSDKQLALYRMLRHLGYAQADAKKRSEQDAT